MLIGNHSYPTYQVFIALFVSVFLTLLFMPALIKLLRYRKIGQQVRADGPRGHLVKQGTPTMGGIVMILITLVTCLLFTRWNTELILLFIAFLATALLGFIDDVSKVAYKRSLGLRVHHKLILQAIISSVFALGVVNILDITPTVSIPGINLTFDLSLLSLNFGDFQIPPLYLLFVFLFMAGFSNSVNLTDGLDGLAAGTVMIVMLVMAMIAFRSNSLPLAIFAASCAGTCIGFLWFNCHPAEIFMGDTGSLALGTAFAGLAILTRTEFISLIVGALFIAEAMSDIIQVASFKMSGKRAFLMAPIHHHFEKKGWSETTVVIRFWIITAACAALGFTLYFQVMFR